MTLDDLKVQLKKLVDEQVNGGGDEEVDHVMADDLLLTYIGDAEVVILFKKLRRWYA